MHIILVARDLPLWTWSAGDLPSWSSWRRGERPAVVGAASLGQRAAEASVWPGYASGRRGQARPAGGGAELRGPHATAQRVASRAAWRAGPTGVASSAADLPSSWQGSLDLFLSECWPARKVLICLVK